MEELLVVGKHVSRFDLVTFLEVVDSDLLVDVETISRVVGVFLTE